MRRKCRWQRRKKSRHSEEGERIHRRRRACCCRTRQPKQVIHRRAPCTRLRCGREDQVVQGGQRWRQRWRNSRTRWPERVEWCGERVASSHRRGGPGRKRRCSWHHPGCAAGAISVPKSAALLADSQRAAGQPHLLLNCTRNLGCTAGASGCCQAVSRMLSSSREGCGC